MMVDHFLRQLAKINGVFTAAAATDAAMDVVAEQIRIPADHVNLLRLSNGLTVFDGYFRLFGAESSPVTDMLTWNDPATWKFAWGDAIDEFWLFGETAWGDQYAYRRDELNGVGEPPVYYLEGITMKSEIIADSFGAFLKNELLRNASDPYDEMIRPVRERLGALEPSEHIVHVPSILITETEHVDRVSKMGAVEGMVINGDLCQQLSSETWDRAVIGLEPYRDSTGRSRMRVLWGEGDE